MLLVALFLEVSYHSLTKAALMHVQETNMRLITQV